MTAVKRQEIYRGRDKYIFFPSLYIFPIYLYIYSWVNFKHAHIKTKGKWVLGETGEGKGCNLQRIFLRCTTFW